MRNWLKNIKISSKLVVGVVIVAFIFLIISFIDAEQSGFMILISALVVGMVISLAIMLYISSIISKPIQKSVMIAEMLAEGNINIDDILTEDDKQLKFRKDEIGMLARAFHNIIATTVEQARETKAIANGDLTTSITVRSDKDMMGKALTELVEEFHELATSIASSSEQVESGAKLVADSSTSLSQGAEEQASSVEELTASLEEITSQTNRNAQNADKANELAKIAAKNAEEGNTQMKEMLKAMDEINESSNSINSIIKVIEDIAFQTNILALNAAVEAARAGQYGKGFAVVAEEVRTLAGHSSKAASETTSLIENSIKKVEAGTKIAVATAGALNEIVDEVEKTSDLVSAIAQASKEQSAAIEQINQGISQVSQVVQTNAATSEEAAAASEELSAQATQLKEFVGVFKIKEIKSFAKPEERKAGKFEGGKLSKKSSFTSGTSKANISLGDSDFGKY